jgi:hypothetical protein
MRKQIKYNNGFYDGDVINNDIKHGFGKYFWNDGSRYEGQWQNDKRNGKGKFVWSNGDVYEGEFQNGMQNGFGKIIYKNGKILSGKFLNGKPVNTNSVYTAKTYIPQNIPINTSTYSKPINFIKQSSPKINFPIIKYIIIGIIFLVAFKTNPTSKDFIDYAVHEYTKNTDLKGNDTIISMFSSDLLKDNVKRTDCYFFSFYDFQIDNSFLIDIHVKVQAVGIFGKIIITNYLNK